MVLFVFLFTITIFALGLALQLRLRKRASAEAIHFFRILDSITEVVNELLIPKRFISFSEMEDFQTQHPFKKLASQLPRSRPKLSFEDEKRVNELTHLLNDPNQWRNQANEKFVTDAVMRHGSLFDRVEAHPLTAEQRVAIVKNEDANLVVAGAGTGKTSTIVGRVAYLIEENLASPSEILVLAFAKKARVELEERFAELLPGKVPDIQTFHALGYSILGKGLGARPDLHESAERGLRAFFVEYLEQLATEPATQYQIAEFLTLFGVRLPSEESEAERPVTPQGFSVRSFEEFELANWYHLNGYEVAYEVPYAEAETANEDHSSYKPDFRVADGVYHEHWGLNRAGETRHDIDGVKYRQEMEWKKALHLENDTKLIETFSYQFTERTWEDDLSTQLSKLGIPQQDVDLAQLISDLRHDGDLDRFTAAAAVLETFTQLFKGSGQTIDELKVRLGDIPNAFMRRRAELFVEVFDRSFAAYEKELEVSGKIDFTDMCTQATDLTLDGSYLSPYTHILVDEFQDISIVRSELLEALLDNDNYSRFFAVGDDWQSIFRFTGSALEVMATDQFDSRFGHKESSFLQAVFRYNSSIEASSSRFIQENSLQIKKQLLTQRSSDNHGIHVYYHGPNSGHSHKYAALDKIINEIEGLSGAESSILALGRYRFNEDALEYLDLPSNLSINFQTVHGSKGLEADFVILLDAIEDKWGFPSQHEDDPVIQLVTSDHETMEYAEERRLFYVALTRARDRVYIICDEDRPSRFVEEIVQYDEVLEVGSANEAIRCPTCESPMTMRIGEGRSRVFWGCREWPTCNSTRQLCPVCRTGAVLAEARNACSEAECHDPQPCIRPGCSGWMSQRPGRNGPFQGCSEYPECEQTRNITFQTFVPCPSTNCEGSLGSIPESGQLFYGCDQFPRCDVTADPTRTCRVEGCDGFQARRLNTRGREMISCTNKQITACNGIPNTD